jgi:Tuberculosis necrotizing toxin
MGKTCKRVNRKRKVLKKKTKKTKQLTKRRYYRKKRFVGGESMCDYDPANIEWPANNGCLEGTTETEIQLEPGKILDRFGGDQGFYFGDNDSSFDSRSLVSLKPDSGCESEYHERLETKKILYNKFIVLKPFTVKTCEIAPAFGHQGNGIQFRTFENSIPDSNSSPNVKKLIDTGYIKIYIEPPISDPVTGELEEADKYPPFRDVPIPSREE